MVTVTVTISGGPKNSIYNELVKKLGREPTAAELKQEVKRIIKGATP
jgi:hypothetical protein